VVKQVLICLATIVSGAFAGDAVEVIGCWRFEEGGGMVAFDDGPGAYNASFGTGGGAGPR